MLKLPETLLTKYQFLLNFKNIPQKDHTNYKKYLRYYLDYCQKYGKPYTDPVSLTLFIKKLNKKNQSIEQQQVAKKAVLLYYSGIGKNLQSSRPLSSHKDEERGSDNTSDNQEKWQVSLESLSNEIKLRHYSPKTHKTYTIWVKKFRNYTEEKQIEHLSTDDVKKYLTYLAVEKKVSASSQNQAFNSLFFFLDMF